MQGTDAESIQEVLDEIKSKKLTLSGNITTQAATRIECLRMADSKLYLLNLAHTYAFGTVFSFWIHRALNTLKFKEHFKLCSLLVL